MALLTAIWLLFTMLSSLGKAGPPLFLNAPLLQLASGFGYGEEPWNQVALCSFLRGIISELAPETVVSKMSTCMITCVSSLYAEEAPCEVQKRNADLVISLCQKSVLTYIKLTERFTLSSL